jgi:hypothetical protein
LDEVVAAGFGEGVDGVVEGVGELYFGGIAVDDAPGNFVGFSAGVFVDFLEGGGCFAESYGAWAVWLERLGRGVILLGDILSWYSWESRSSELLLLPGSRERPGTVVF